MENFFPVFGTIAVLALGLMAFFALRNDETYARRLAKIRVPVDERSRKRTQERQEEEYDNRAALAWLTLGMSVILVLILLQAL